MEEWAGRTPGLWFCLVCTYFGDKWDCGPFAGELQLYKLLLLLKPGQLPCWPPVWTWQELGAKSPSRIPCDGRCTLLVSVSLGVPLPQILVHRQMVKFMFPPTCGTSGKEPACQCRGHRRRRFNPLGGEDPLEEGMATHCSILAWGIPWTEGPGGLQSIRVRTLPLYFYSKYTIFTETI